jgi:hypothetical protein
MFFLSLKGLRKNGGILQYTDLRDFGIVVFGPPKAVPIFCNAFEKITCLLLMQQRR